jgi:AMP deaminase
VRSFAFKHLELLSAKFNLHELLNAERENDATKSVPHRDFYNVRKVDTHVHHSACMNQKHLLRFIKNKLRNNYDEVVVFRDGKFLTLGEVFKSLNLTAYDLSIDTLDMHANNTFHRFDRFNLKYNPAGQSRLREIFLKTDNVIGGRYLAEITKEVIDDLEQSKYQLVEWRISIYGRKLSEWSSLAQWFYVNRLAHANVRWLIQIPRIYHIYRKGGELKNFGEMLHNIFQPLFEVTLDPSSNVPLHYFLEAIVGFDSVDDESRPEYGVLSSSSSSSIPLPDDWCAAENPPYGYWMYYMYANICTLNQLRAKRGLSTFQFRPHCGEAGDVDHLVSTYLLAQQVNHGILLRKAPALHYLYYLSQVGIAMSPLSNNKLFLDYNKNPFPKYFKQGMNVSLSTDDPLMLHYTKDALVEEYSVATQVWKLSSTDQCEIARNSVIQSGWEDVYKRHFLGEGFSDMRETNVPIFRLRFRQETLDEEVNYIKKTSNL